MQEMVNKVLPVKLCDLNNANVRPATPQQSPIKQLDSQSLPSCLYTACHAYKRGLQIRHLYYLSSLL
jgi:hypothetical protein